MLGNNLSADRDPIPGDDVVTLTRINQDAYSSEYRGLDGIGVKYTAFIRHTTEKTKVNGLTMKRHQVLIRSEEAPSEIYPGGRLSEAYVIWRLPDSMNSADGSKVLFSATRLAALLEPSLLIEES